MISEKKMIGKWGTQTYSWQNQPIFDIKSESPLSNQPTTFNELNPTFSASVAYQNFKQSLSRIEEKLMK